MSTTTETQPQAPHHLRSLSRVASVPIVHDTLGSIDALLLQNFLTAWPYATARSVSGRAYTVSEPLLAPVLSPVDGLANKGLDYVQSRYPYPFETPTDEVVADVMKQRDQLVDVAVKTYDARIKSPVVGLAVGADQTIAPIVDILQTAYDKLNSKTSTNGSLPSAPSDGNETQVHRAVRLSFGLKDQVIVLSSEQLRQLQADSVVLQRLTDAVYQLNALVASTVTTTKDKSAAVTKEGYARASALADATRAELEKLSSAISTLPSHVQTALGPITSQIHELTDALGNDLARGDTPAGEKVSLAVKTVREKVPPILEETIKIAREAIVSALGYVQGAAQASKEPVQNGNGSVNGDGKH